jgi:rhamnulokinase
VERLFAAIDVGASSGRVITGLFREGKLSISEVHRFYNGPVENNGLLTWDFSALMQGIHDGLNELNQEALKLGLPVHSIGIDTWAVDYGLLKDGELLAPPNCYRDPINQVGVDLVHSIAPFEELYLTSGLQFLPFNSLYQLARQQKLDADLIAQADFVVMIPDLIGYFLTGELATERTNASSTGLINALSRDWDFDLAAKLGIDLNKFPKLADSGAELGKLTGDFGQALADTQVILVGSHDTASAVVGTPSTEKNFAFLSSGTWSLLGAEIASPILTERSREANFTNELGVDGRVRYLKNLSGLWLLTESIRDFELAAPKVDIASLIREISTLVPTQRIDVSDPSLMTPGSMMKKIQDQLLLSNQEPYGSMGELAAIILHSLGQSYADNLEALEELVGKQFSVLHVIGGGVQNELLCQLTADYTNTRVLAGPVEATAIGNILIQARSSGLTGPTLEDLRAVIIASDLGVREFIPRS